MLAYYCIWNSMMPEFRYELAVYLGMMGPSARTAAAARKERCELCNQEMETGSLVSHLQSRYNVRHCDLDKEVCSVVPRTFEARYMPMADK